MKQGSEEYREFQSEMRTRLWRDPVHREMMLRSLRGRKMPSWSTELKRRWKDPFFRERMLSRLCSKEACIRRSETLSKKIASGDFRPVSRYKRGWFQSCRMNRSFYYASSYELAALEKMENDVSVVKYCRSSSRIQYLFLGKVRRYIPDFVVWFSCGLKVIVEVKPWCRWSEPKNVAKFKALCDYVKVLGFMCGRWSERDLVVA